MEAESRVRAEPTSLQALGSLASAYWKTGRFQEATSVCERLVAISPGNAAVWNGLGLANLALGNIQIAVEKLSEAVRLQPNSAEFLHNLAGSLERAGKLKRAVTAYEAALEIQPNSISCLYNLAELRFRIANAETYRDMLRRLRGSKHQEELQHGDAQDSLGLQVSQAKHLVLQLLEITPSHARGHLLLGSILQHEGDHPAAREEFRIAIQLDSSLASAYRQLADISKFTKEDLPLVQHIQRMTQETRYALQDRVFLFGALAKAANDLGDYAGALAYADEGHRASSAQLVDSFDRGELQEQIDELISFFDTEFFERYLELKCVSEVPIFVVGMPRSGTTLTEQILASHPDVSGAGELPYWPDLATRAYDAHSRIYRQERAKRLGRLYLDALTRIGPKRERIVDKNPFNSAHIGLLHALYPKARFINCRRHPVDNCLSLYFANFRYAPSYVHERSNLVFAYREHVRLMAHWKDVIPPDRFLEISYEDIVLRQEATTRNLIQFCGLEWDNRCLYPDQHERIVMTASQWQVRQPVYLTSVDRWKKYQNSLGEFAQLLEV
jgi:Flp pilus assembly protein TadD